MARYRAWEDVVELSEEKEYPLKIIKLSREVATLQIRSSPPGAVVYVDGIQRGKTPVSVELPFGDHRIRGEIHGHYPQEASVRLQESTPPPVNLKFPAIENVFLQLDSKPSEAEVYVDGKRLGRTPLRVEIPRTTHRLRLTLSRHKDWEGSIDLSELEEKSLFCMVVDLKTGWSYAYECNS